MLTGLMLAGRVGSGIAAELGSMVVTDQINALRALGTDPDPQAGRAARAGRLLHGAGPDGHRRHRRHRRRLAHRGLPAARRVERLLDLGHRRRSTCRTPGWGSSSRSSSASSIVTIGCHVGLRTQRRHAGRRPRHDQRRGRGVGGGDRRGLLRDAAADYAAVSDDAADATLEPELDERARTGRAGRRVRQRVAGLRRQGRSCATSASRCCPGTPRSSWAPAAREVDDPEADPRAAEARRRRRSGSTASASTG